MRISQRKVYPLTDKTRRRSVINRRLSRYRSTGLLAIALFTLCLVTGFAAGTANAQETEAGDSSGLSADEAARQLANPNTPLASLTLKTQYRWYDGDIPDADNQDNLYFLFQPVFPFPIARTDTEEGEILDQIFFRPAFPFIVDQPVFDLNSGGFDDVDGFGDIVLDIAWGRNYPSGLLTAVGAVSSIPTGKGELSTDTWTLGPEVFVGQFERWASTGSSRIINGTSAGPRIEIRASRPSSPSSTTSPVADGRSARRAP